MKMVMIIYNEAMDLEVMEILEDCALKNYTKLTGSFGKGTHSGTHMGNDIWPGRNNVIYTACKEEEAEKLFSCVTNLKTRLSHEGIKAFAWTLDEIV